MYSLNWHRSLDVCKLLDAQFDLTRRRDRRALTRSVWTELNSYSSRKLLKTHLFSGGCSALRIVTVFFSFARCKDVNLFLTYLALFALILYEGYWQTVRYVVARTAIASRGLRDKSANSVVISRPRLLLYLLRHRNECDYSAADVRWVIDHRRSHYHNV